jgi:glucose/arabinose dehydrogenase
LRKWHSLVAVLGLLLPAACGDSGSNNEPLPPFAMGLQEVFGTAAMLDGPIDLQAPPGDARLFIAERPGRIRVAQNGALLPTPFLDISSRVTTQGEAGLLSFAFDAQFSTNGFVYVHFIENVPNTTGDIVVERYQVSSNPNLLDVSSVQPLIRIPHRDANNHYGGRVAFGPDGMLYVSAGDGGGGNNQFGHAQDAASHLGKLLRIDVSTLPYTIPADNPVWPNVGQNENWAIGLRNPFRYAFDVPTGQLYIADVGQGAREEIDVVSAGASGLNYGWSIMEGTLCLAIGGPCTTPGLTAPVYEYDHGQGCAIIGGYVYRGAAIPELHGQYLFSDLCGAFVRSLGIENGIATVREAPMVNVGTPLSFGQDGFGEVYVLTADGRVLRVVKQ